MFTKEGLSQRAQFPFSDQATTTINLAEEESRMFGHNYIGTEHLLLGLSRSELPALQLLGVEVGKVRRGVEWVIGRGVRVVHQDDIGFTPRAFKIVELAVDEARRAKDTQLGNSHLLVGVVREGEGIAAGVLESLGVSLEKVRLAINRVGGAEMIQPDLLVLKRLEVFLEDPSSDNVKKQQLKMILDGALGLILPPNQK